MCLGLLQKLKVGWVSVGTEIEFKTGFDAAPKLDYRFHQWAIIITAFAPNRDEPRKLVLGLISLAQIVVESLKRRFHAASADGLAARLAILTSIPGIAKLTAFAILIEMPERGSLDNKQVAALAGLAPIARQSGQWKGKAFIRDGRAQLRLALFMPALVAARYNPDLKAKYTQLIAAAKPAKVALTAIMRKLIVLANSLIAQNRNWVQIRP